MNRIATACLVAVSLTSAVMATTADVYFDVRASYVDFGTDPLPIGLDSGMQWTVSVRVTGDNQGLGGFTLDLCVKDMTRDIVAPCRISANWATTDDGAGNEVGTFKAPGSTGHGYVYDLANNGGPGMSYGVSTGTPATDIAYITQIGASHLDWVARFYGTYVGGGTRKKWQGDHTWGVGLDSRKSTLLWDANGTYDILSGTIDFTDCGPGQYQIAVIPSRPVVLASGIDLNVNQPGGFTVHPEHVYVNNADFFFPPPAEPATLILLAASAVFVRRRPVPAASRLV